MPFVERILVEMRGASTTDERRGLVRVLLGAKLATIDGQGKAVEVVEHLLSIRQKTDDESARLSLEAVGSPGPSRARLESAISRRGVDIDDRWRQSMLRAGLRVPKLRRRGR